MIIEFENQIKKFDNIWFISDQHHGHNFIRTTCNRPFNTVEEMDQTIIDNTNKLVHRDNLLICLGDFSYWKDKATKTFYHYFNQYNCLNWIYIFGNHCKKIKNAVKTHKDILWSGDLLDITIQHGEVTKDIVLSHYPLLSWNKSFHGSYCLHGHTHQNKYEIKNLLNVCVEQTNYGPISFQEVVDRVNQNNQLL